MHCFQLERCAAVESKWDNLRRTKWRKTTINSLGAITHEVHEGGDFAVLGTLREYADAKFARKRSAGCRGPECACKPSKNQPKGYPRTSTFDARVTMVPAPLVNGSISMTGIVTVVLTRYVGRCTWADDRKVGEGPRTGGDETAYAALVLHGVGKEARGRGVAHRKSQGDSRGTARGA